MKRKVDSDYVNRKSAYRHFVLGCCTKCRSIQVYKVTDSIVKENSWKNIEMCNECEGFCGVCILSKYQNPPGFARKCKKCDFRFTCATVRIEEIPAILIGLTTVKFKAEDIEEV